jgi:2-oxoglutarate ferredoxin oxidoreductase subunit alpha
MMVEKRFYKKMAGLAKEIEPPTAFNLKDADIVLVGFGSTYGVLKETCEAVPERKTGFIHLSQVWPFPSASMIDLLKDAKKIVTVENNAGAQLAQLIKREAGIESHRSILKFDGRPFNLDFVMQQIKEM